MIYRRLTDVFEGKIPYNSVCDYPVMISAYENLYKGMVRELSSHPEYNINIPEEKYIKGHRFHNFASCTNRIIPLADDLMQWRFVYGNCKTLEDRYTPARFESLYDFEEFKTAYRRFEVQLNRCYKGLEQIDKMPPVSSMEEDAAEDYDMD